MIELVQSFDPNNDGKIAFLEFLQVMRALENRTNQETLSFDKTVSLKCKFKGKKLLKNISNFFFFKIM